MAASLESTLLILKPDAVQRRLMGRILERIENKGLQVVGMRMTRIPRALALRHYRAHRGKPFFPSLIRYITSGPVVLLAVRGKSAIAVARGMMGATFGSKAAPGTLRGDFALSDSFNLIHGSDSPAASRRELRLYFKPSELHLRPMADRGWIYDLSEGTPV